MGDKDTHKEHKAIVHRDLGDEHHEEHHNIKATLIQDIETINIVEEYIEIVDADGNSKLIDADMISLSDDDAEYYKVVEATMEQIENGEVECPYSGSKDLYRISEGIYASYDAEMPFVLKIIH